MMAGIRTYAPGRQESTGYCFQEGIIHLKKLAFIYLLLILGFSSSCANSRESSSNTGPEKNSLPAPSSNTMATSTNTTPANYNSNSAFSEENFWITAAEVGIAEVEMGKLAARKAQNPEVKKFAQMMITDRSKANLELKAAAGKKKVKLPDTYGPNQKSTIDELNRLTGADFDREYVQAIIDGHTADISLFEDQSEDDSDPEAKAFAAKSLPVLKKHLDAIKAIQARMN